MMRIKLGACLFAVSALAACSFGTSGEPSTGGGVDAAVHTTTPPAVCGDGICSASEASSCPQDCGPGGNGSGSGSGSGSGAAVCGDSVCAATETAATCPSDCGGGGGGALNCADQNVQLACILCVGGLGCTGVDMAGCQTCLGGGGTPPMACGDGTCDAAGGETHANCPIDCM